MWQLEATAVAVFAVFGLVRVRVPFASSSDICYTAMGRGPRVQRILVALVGLGTTSVPLAYGFFVPLDFLMPPISTLPHHWYAA
jgi:hypothetical protein